MSDRCPASLEARIPDTAGYRDAVVVIQCGRDQGHRGVHRHADEITWTGDSP